jgi:hypothetical protein
MIALLCTVRAMRTGEGKRGQVMFGVDVPFHMSRETGLVRTFDALKVCHFGNYRPRPVPFLCDPVDGH